MIFVAIYIYSYEQTYVKPSLLFLNFVGSCFLGEFVFPRALVDITC